MTPELHLFDSLTRSMRRFEPLREGEARGEARAEARWTLAALRSSLRRVLAKRGLSTTPEQERRIDECVDPRALERWHDAAIVATTSAEALDGA